jgi:hypothetical protein
MDAGVLIPITAIVGTFAIPITAIVMDYRRRRLQSEERRAMIERGMQPPPLESESFDFGKWRRDPAARRESSLRSGFVFTFLGIGLGVAAWLLVAVVDQSFIPVRVAGSLAVASAVVTFLGVGNLAYYAFSAKRAVPPAS